MRKITVLMITLMWSAYGMDNGPAPQEQGQEHQEPGLGVLRQDRSTIISKIPMEHFPIIEGYKVARNTELQQKLDQAKTLEEIIELGRADEHFKVAPVSLNLYKFKDKMTVQDLGTLVGLFPNMIKLDLQLCSAITDDGLAYLKGLTMLQELNLLGTAITDKGLIHLKDLKELQRLFLGMSAITDDGLTHLKDLVQLKILSLWSTKITDDGLTYLQDLSQLEQLSLSDCRNITDAGLVHLNGLTQLKFLILSSTNITDTGVSALKEALPNLTVIK